MSYSYYSAISRDGSSTRLRGPSADRLISCSLALAKQVFKDPTASHHVCVTNAKPTLRRRIFDVWEKGGGKVSFF